MPPKLSDDQVSQAVLKFVTDGAFPESEDVVSAVLSADATANGLRSISKAKSEIQQEIRSLSQETAPDVDDWISQAKQLHADIERSRVTAREIVIQHDKGRQLRKEAAEAEQRLKQLQDDISFAETVSSAYEEIGALRSTLARAHEALANAEHHQAFELLHDLENRLEATFLPRDTHVLRVFSSRCSDLRSSISDDLRRQWTKFVEIDHHTGQMAVASDDASFTLGIETLLADLSNLGLLDSVIDSFQQDIVGAILNPLLSVGAGDVRTVSVERNKLRLLTRSTAPSVTHILDDVLVAFGYFQQYLPSPVLDRILPKLFPAIGSELIENWITPAVPVDIASVDHLEQLILHVSRFVERLKDHGWHGSEEVAAWIEQIPRLWQHLRRAQCLDEVRRTIAGSTGKTSTVERVEKGRVSSDGDISAEKGTQDDWNTAWASDNENAEPAAGTEGAHDDDEDVSAWGLDDDDDDDAAEAPGPVEEGGRTAGDDEDDVDEAWGWGDDKENDTPGEPAAGSQKKIVESRAQSPSHSEMTLRELYEVTDIPSSVLSIITQQVSDGELLAKPENANLRIASSGPSLFALPTLIVAMFKASAPLFYPQKFRGGQMLLYNDCMYLAEQLRSLCEQHNLSKLRSDVDSLERFARTAYGKEMYSQRTILTDLLDGCQGFGNCAAQPFLGECQSSVSATVERLRDVYKEWEPILSRSALLQSIGSLLSTVIDKMILDIEDLADISDAESQRLAEFCGAVSKLEELFVSDRPMDESSANAPEPIPMTAMYVPNWLKFQYLSNILEGSLADIKYFWSEGGLKLEFTAEEVIDLIKALFADSEHRRRAIAEIRRTSSVA